MTYRAVHAVRFIIYYTSYTIFVVHCIRHHHSQLAIIPIPFGFIQITLTLHNKMVLTDDDGRLKPYAYNYSWCYKETEQMESRTQIVLCRSLHKKTPKIWGFRARLTKLSTKIPKYLGYF